MLDLGHLFWARVPMDPFSWIRFPGSVFHIFWLCLSHLRTLARAVRTVGRRDYSTVHKIVHWNWKLLVKEIFMCFEVIWIVYVSRHSILLKIIVIVHCSSHPISRKHYFSRNCTKIMIARSSLVRTVYHPYDFEAHKNLSHKQFSP